MSPEALGFVAILTDSISDGYNNIGLVLPNTITLDATKPITPLWLYDLFSQQLFLSVIDRHRSNEK